MSKPHVDASTLSRHIQAQGLLHMCTQRSVVYPAPIRLAETVLEIEEKLEELLYIIPRFLSTHISDTSNPAIHNADARFHRQPLETHISGITTHQN